jgi:dihydrolipoamide dehydrogenase
MPAETPYDLAVLGAGPGGYSCALRAAQHGLRVAIVERDRVGGVCLNRGCVPTKVMLQAATLMRTPAAASPLGVDLGKAQLDYARLLQRQAEVVRWLTSGVEALLYKRQVEVLHGSARLAPDGMVAIDGQDGHRVIRASNRVIATGSSERSIPGITIDGETVIGSTEALRLPQLPRSIAIIGAGAVGTEFASMFVDFGCQVTLIEALPHILPLEDEECAAVVADALQKRGVAIHVATPVRGLAMKDGLATLTCECAGERFDVSAEKVLVAVGRRPNTADLGLEALGVQMQRGQVVVDADLRSSVPGLYAIGDCIPTLALAHVAEAEGKYVADLVAGQKPRRLGYDAVPRATYCEPEVASVGLSEAQAREQGLDVVVGKAPLRSNGKAAIYGDMTGLVKIVAERGSGRVRGIHIVGHAATELIAEAALSVRLEATAREISETIHAHPTISEAVLEAAEEAWLASASQS